MKCNGAVTDNDARDCSSPEPKYVWTGSHGGEYYLCDYHVAKWCSEVQGISVLEPIRIRTLQP
jgi:hypothetical protein